MSEDKLARTAASVNLTEIHRVLMAIQAGLKEADARGVADLVFVLARRPPEWSVGLLTRAEVLAETPLEDLEARGILGEPAPEGKHWTMFLIVEAGGEHRYFGHVDAVGRMHDAPRYAPKIETFPRRLRGAVRRLRATLAMQRKLLIH